jgi:hypothetical protein
LQALVAASALILLAALYLVLMRLSVDLSRIEDEADANVRDNVYFALHLGLLLAAALAGYVLGRWLGGFGFAYGVLFVVVLALFMTFSLFGAQALACEGGRNDVIRHWECA